MKQILFFLVLIALASRAEAQTMAIDSISGERVLIGAVSRSAFSDSSWYTSNRALYHPTQELIKQIDSSNAVDSVLVVFGSWCSDSHMWVPMFLSILDSTSLAGKEKYIAVPRSKGWRDQLTPGLDIEKVPTFIFYRDGKELGRIVEEPEGDLGDNVLRILKGTK